MARALDFGTVKCENHGLASYIPGAVFCVYFTLDVQIDLILVLRSQFFEYLREPLYQQALEHLEAARPENKMGPFFLPTENGWLFLTSFKACDCSGHICSASACPRSLTTKLAMPPSSTIHGGQHDTKYVNFELLVHAAFVVDEICGFILEPARTLNQSKTAQDMESYIRCSTYPKHPLSRMGCGRIKSKQNNTWYNFYFLSQFQSVVLKVDRLSAYPTIVSFLYRNGCYQLSLGASTSMTKQLSWHDEFDCRRLSLASTPLNILTSYVRIPKRIHKLNIPSESYICYRDEKCCGGILVRTGIRRPTFFFQGAIRAPWSYGLIDELLIDSADVQTSQ